MMKKILVNAAMALPLFLALDAAAETCPVIEFQELKDMNKKELVEEYCRAVKTAGDNIQASLSALEAGRNPKQTTDEAGQCQDQAKRVSRILAKKGVKTKEYDVFCKGVP